MVIHLLSCYPIDSALKMAEKKCINVAWFASLIMIFHDRSNNFVSPNDRSKPWLLCYLVSTVFCLLSFRNPLVRERSDLLTHTHKVPFCTQHMNFVYWCVELAATGEKQHGLSQQSITMPVGTRWCVSQVAAHVIHLHRFWSCFSRELRTTHIQT